MQPTNTDTIKVTQLDFTVDECTAEVYLNGLPIRRYQTNNLKFTSIPCLAELKEGINTLELVVNTGPTPTRAVEGAELIENKPRTQAKGFAEVKVVRYPEGVYPEDPSGNILAALSLDASSDPKAHPRLARTTFIVEKKDEPNLRRWAWQDAKKIDLKSDHAAILAVVQTAWNDMESGQYSPASFELQRIQLTEGFYAFPAMGDAESNRLDLENHYKKRAAKAGWAMQPLDTAQFDFRLCAEGRLVQIVNKDWIPSVRSVPLDAYRGPDDFSMKLGKVGGKFIILR